MYKSYEKIEEEFFEKGIVVIPDFIANAGGVISSYAEYRGYNPRKMMETIEKKIVKNVNLIIKKGIKKNKSLREVGMEIAVNRLNKAKNPR